MGPDETHVERISETSASWLLMIYINPACVFNRGFDRRRFNTFHTVFNQNRSVRMPKPALFNRGRKCVEMTRLKFKAESLLT